jgi:hypothetical protein
MIIVQRGPYNSLYDLGCVWMLQECLLQLKLSSPHSCWPATFYGCFTQDVLYPNINWLEARLIQILKKYRFFVFMVPPALIMFVDLLLGVEQPSPVNFLGSCSFILACISVPAGFGKEEK